MQQFMHRFLLVSGLLISAECLFAQTTRPDVLYRLDRTTQNVRVKEVTDVEVFYTESNAPNTVRKIRKVELWKVVFGDGTSDVYNEPKASKPTASKPATRPATSVSKPLSTSTSVTRPAPPASKPAVTSTPATRPTTPAPAASLVAETPQPAPAKADQPADLGSFLAGRQALSLGVDLAGVSTTNKNSRGSTTTTTNNIALTVLYQQFKSDNVSMGGGLSVGLTRAKSSSSAGDNVQSSPFVRLSGLTRRYLPVASNVAFYGFGSAELELRWYKSKSPSISETYASQQQVALNAGAGMTYLFNPGFSIDFNASLLGLTIDRLKGKSPGSKAAVDLSVTGAGVVPSFSLFLTRYF